MTAPSDSNEAKKITSPEERAKNIASLLNYSPHLADTNYAAVIEEIKQAQAEAVKEFCKERWIISAYQKEAYEKGAVEMRERCAEVVKRDLMKSMGQSIFAEDWLAERIRALRPKAGENV